MTSHPGPTYAPSQTSAAPWRRSGGSGAQVLDILDPLTLDEAESARDRAMCHLRDAEHWRRLVAARLDLAVAAVADIDDLEATLVGLRPLIGMPGADGRLAESSLLIRLRGALDELDRHIAEAKAVLDDATSRVAACIVHEPFPDHTHHRQPRELDTGVV
jgi:hypothetical protein